MEHSDFLRTRSFYTLFSTHLSIGLYHQYQKTIQTLCGNRQVPSYIVALMFSMILLMCVYEMFQAHESF
jgi:hypothetical protein